MSDVQVFVLIRTKLQFGFPWKSKRRYRFFSQALDSVLSQECNNINLNIILLQDSWWRLSSKPQRIPIPRFCRNVINENIKIKNKCSDCNVYFYSCRCKGAAYSMFNIREALFKLSRNDNDIAILLDDDDILAYSGAVKDIYDCMQNREDGKDGAGVCISQFEIIGEVDKSIVNRGGYRHNKLVEQIDLKPEMKEPYGEGSLCFADSLGWTKSYRVGVLKQYHNDLLCYFGSRRNLKRFMCRNNAYEDFPDIINLCRKDVNVVGLPKKTHSYRKLSGSITSTPHKSDFVHKRPNYLALLMGLYKYLDGGCLKSASKVVVARYFAVKVLTVENILAKYRSDEEPHWGMIKYENGYFMRRLLDVLRKNDLLYDFLELLKDVKCLDESGNNATAVGKGKPDSPFKILELTCRNEALKGRVDIGNLLCDKQVRFRVNRIKKNYLKYAVIVLIGILLSCLVYILVKDSNDRWTAVLPMIGSLASFIYLIFKDAKNERELQERYTERFCESVDELQRHLMAGLRVLFAIKRDMESSKSLFPPAKVHFANLQVFSQLLTNQWDDFLVLEKFGYLPNLRVDIRNINNSAKFMEEYVESSMYCPEKMKEIIDWEIVRYVGYITRFRFFADKKSFVLPNVKQLSIYVMYDDVLQDMAKRLSSELSNNEQETLKELNGYFKRYIDGRKNEPEVLFL